MLEVTAPDSPEPGDGGAMPDLPWIVLAAVAAGLLRGWLSLCERLR